MEPKFSKTGVISTLIILALIAIPGVWVWQHTDWENDRLFEETAQRQVIPEFQEDSRIFDDRILLRKDKGITVNRSRLVFRGVEDRAIRLDVYLLELDPDVPYPHYIPESDPPDRFRLGDTEFKLLDLSRGVVQLKVLELFKS